MRRQMRGTLLLVLCLATGLSAQTDPRQLPRLDTSKIVKLGTFTFDWPDGAGGDLSYGGPGMSVSLDRQFLYLTCNTGHPKRGVAKLRIPAIGAVQFSMACSATAADPVSSFTVVLPKAGQ